MKKIPAKGTQTGKVFQLVRDGGVWSTAGVVLLLDMTPHKAAKVMHDLVRRKLIGVVGKNRPSGVGGKPGYLYRVNPEYEAHDD